MEQTTDPLDPDTDDDTILDGSDNCALLANPGQTNTDGDSEGDGCDTDDDSDGDPDPGFNDGFSDADEAWIGTDPLDDCPRQHLG